MNKATRRGLKSAGTAGPFDVLSAEPATRAVELAFLRRLLEDAESEASAILTRARQTDDSVAANLARMQSPVYKRAAQALEKSVPVDAGFGKFRDRN